MIWMICYKEYLFVEGHRGRGGLSEVAAFLVNVVVRARCRACCRNIDDPKHGNQRRGAIAGTLLNHVRPRFHPKPESKAAARASFHRVL